MHVTPSHSEVTMRRYVYITRIRHSSASSVPVLCSSTDMLPELCLFLCVAVMGYQPSQAGNGEEGHYDAIGTNSKFTRPGALKLYSSDQYALIGDYTRIRKIDMATMTVTTVAGNGSIGNTDGVGTNAQFVAPYGLAISSDNGFALVTDFDSNYIRQLFLSSRQVITLHQPLSGGGAQNNATAINFNSSRDIVLSGDNTYAIIVDGNNNRIRKFVLSNKVVTTVAGGTVGNADGIGTNAQFENPMGMCMSSDESFILITEFYGNRVRKMVLSTSMVTTIAGSGARGILDAVGTSASFSSPSSVTLSQSDSVAYVSDLSGNTIRHIDMATLNVTSVVGTTIDDNVKGVGTNALFSSSSLGISDEESFMLVCSMKSHRIFKVNNILSLSTSFPTSSPTVLPYNATEASVLCHMISSTNIESILSEWVCGNTGWCTWTGITCEESAITRINLGWSLMTGTIPSSIGCLTKLTNFDMSSNSLTGSLPSSLSYLSKLGELRLRRNLLSGSLPSNIGLMTSLGLIDLSKNLFSGSIPSFSGQMTKLSLLKLENNLFTGVIPSELSLLSSLSRVLLYSNSLSGTIPSELGDMASLNSFVARDNRLTGTLPSSLGKLSDLEILIVKNNSLSGTIPSSYTSLFQLRNLILDENNFQSTFPYEMCAIGSLSAFYISQSAIHECLLPTATPTPQPTCIPSGDPSSHPTGTPSAYPTVIPTSTPSGQPTVTPTVQPTETPSQCPTGDPSVCPTGGPSGQPTGVPSGQPTGVPSGQPTVQPSVQPTGTPSGQPTGAPSEQPTRMPSGQPTVQPSGQPTGAPSEQPTRIPSGQPTTQPSSQPTGVPSGEPTGAPSGQPTETPSGQPTGAPSEQPTGIPSGRPTTQPSSQPTGVPSGEPTGAPSGQPTETPSGQPTGAPSEQPTRIPSGQPTTQPSTQPTGAPSVQPTGAPSGQPTRMPSGEPTVQPSGQPTGAPSGQPTGMPSGQPTTQPSSQPTGVPSGEPTGAPSGQPTETPSGQPTGAPSEQPTRIPSGQPTTQPSTQPTGAPSVQPTGAPSGQPTRMPSGEPTVQPSGQPTGAPSGQPTGAPSRKPSETPSGMPSPSPTGTPLAHPSSSPTFHPSSTPSSLPSEVPTGLPSYQPTTQPSSVPSPVPTSSPSPLPSYVPTAIPSEHPTLRPTHKPTLLGDTIPPTQFPTFSPTFSPTVVPMVPPNLQTCTFSNDGSYVVLALDAASDMGGLGSQFQCSQLFNFSASGSFVCRWKEGASTVWLHSASSIIDVGDSVTMKGGILRAMCPSGASKVECSKWTTASSQSCIVLPPPNPISPVVSISAPSTIGQCDDFVVDISGSSGSGGRDWYDFSVDVFSASNSSYSLRNASDIRRFYRSLYKYTPPTPLPGSYLKAVEVYTFEIRLCNFLQKCSSATHNVVVKARSVPVATIVGQAQRNAYRHYPLVLSSHAYTASCGADETQRGLSFDWLVVKNGTKQDNLINTNPDSSKFKLLPYSLDVGEVYVIVFTVTHDGLKVSTSSSIEVSVLPSPVVAVIEGGSVQTMRYGESLVLDGSGSYDSDLYDVGGVAAGLSLMWSCVNSVDSSGNGCDLTLTPSASLETVTVTADSESLVNTETFVTLTVSGSYNRSDVAIVRVRITPPLSPKVSLSLLSRKVNYAEKVVVRAFVEVFSSATAEWLVNDGSIDLVSSALTQVRRVVTPGGVTAFNLVLGGSTLHMGASFTFTCSVGTTSSSVTVDVIAPPLPGRFVVDPTSGYELQDKFMMVASRWTDSELPLTYSFGYISASGDLLTLHARSELTYIGSTLPAGSPSANHSVTCQVTVYNLLDANAMEFYTVTVEPVTSTSEDLSTIVINLLKEGESSIDSTTQAIAILTGVINAVNCSLAPDCASLHRNGCASTSHSCGKCWTGYFGAEGDANSMCYSGSSNMDTLGLLCSTNNDCGIYQSCTDQVCEYMLKQCPRNCTRRGTCQMEEISTGKVTDSCRADDVSCRAVCICDNGFSGDACDISTEVLEIKQQSRWHLIDSVSTTVMYNEPTPDNIGSTVATVSQLSANPVELTPDACVILYDLVDFLLDSAGELELAYDVVNVYGAIDTCSSIVTTLSSRRRLTTFSNWTSSAELVDKYSDLISSQIVEGQKDVTYVQSLSRVVSAVRTLDGNGLAVSLPRTGEEEALDIQKSMVIINGSETEGVSSVAVSVVETAAKLYRNNSNFTCNPINVRVSTATSGKAFEEVTVVLRNHYILHDSLFNTTNTSFTTRCSDNEHSTHNYTCPGSNSIVSHECDGTPRILKTTCPISQTMPVCRVLVGGVLDSGSNACEVVDFTVTDTTCWCMINYAQSKRLLSSTGDSTVRSSGSLEVAAIMENSYTDFVETILESDNITVGGVRDVLLVIIMFFSMWAVGLVSMLELTRVSFTHKRNKIQHKSVVGNRTAKSGLEESDTSVQKKYLLNYIRELVPSVFRSDGSSWQCLLSEVAKHHRYVVMFSASGPGAEEIRLQAGLHMLTVQTMLMFLIAIFYDVEYPTDDGTCGTYVDEKSCLSERSMFDTSTTTCAWNLNDDGSGSCVWVEPTISYKVIVIISVLIAVLTAPINLVVDFLFEDILSAPTADEKVVLMTQSMGRRMSQVARRTLHGISSSVYATIKSMAKNKKGLSRLTGSLVLNETTRALPPAVVHSHALARSALGCSLKRLSSEGIVEDTEQGDSNVLSQSSTVNLDAIVCSSKAHRRGAQLARRCGKTSSHDIRSASSVGPEEISNEKMVSVTYDQFLEDFNDQRSILTGESLRDFDDRWGWDARIGRFMTDRVSTFPCTPSIENLIDMEMKNVSSICNEKINKLRIATDVHIGLELLHLFVIDLLGRNSPAGKIFQTKTEEDFKHSFVVTKTAKILAWICVVFLNLFFAYFSILRGMTRSYGWQKGYCVACAIQLIIEVVFYETSECVWINYNIPQLVSSDVERTITALTDTIDYAFSTVKRKRPPLDTPSYFFVSTRVAENFSDLFESSIVLAFHSYYPPSRMSSDWRENGSSNMLGLKRCRSHTRGGVMGLLGRVSVVAILMTLLKYIGTVNIRLQRVILHSAQPIIVAFVFVLVSNLQSNPLYGYMLLGVILFECVRSVVTKRTVTKPIPDSMSPIGDISSEVESRENGSCVMSCGHEVTQKLASNSIEEKLSHQRSKCMSANSPTVIVRQRSCSFRLDSAEVSRSSVVSYLSDSSDNSVSDKEYNIKRRTGISTACEELSMRVRSSSFTSSNGDGYDDVSVRFPVEYEEAQMRLTGISDLDELYYPLSDSEYEAKARGNAMDSEDISEQRDEFLIDSPSSSSGESSHGEIYSITSSSESSKESVHDMMPHLLDCEDSQHESSCSGGIGSRDEYSMSSSPINRDRYMSSDSSVNCLSLYDCSSSETDNVDA